MGNLEYSWLECFYSNTKFHLFLIVDGILEVPTAIKGMQNPIEGT